MRYEEGVLSRQETPTIHIDSSPLWRYLCYLGDRVGVWYILRENLTFVLGWCLPSFLYAQALERKNVILCCCHLPLVGMRPLKLSLGSAWQHLPCSADQSVTGVL